MARNKVLVKFGVEPWHGVLTRRWRLEYFLQSSSLLACKVAAALLGVDLMASGIRGSYGLAGVWLESNLKGFAASPARSG